MQLNNNMTPFYTHVSSVISETFHLINNIDINNKSFKVSPSIYRFLFKFALPKRKKANAFNLKFLYYLQEILYI